MSKKNKKSTRVNAHKADLEREKQAILKKQKKAEKRQAPAAPVSKVKKTKVKGFRIKKGVRVKGIKIVDSESKKKAKQLLAAEAALREMEVDKEEGAADPMVA